MGIALIRTKSTRDYRQLENFRTISQVNRFDVAIVESIIENTIEQ